MTAVLASKREKPYFDLLSDCGQDKKVKKIIVPSLLKGFTLTELIVVVAILAIVAAFAAPSMKDFLVRNSMGAATSQFVSAINLAKTEALRRNQSVSLCASSDGGSCNTENWGSGWVAFVDKDSNGAIDATDTIIKSGSAINSSLQVSENGLASPGLVVFLPDGSISASFTMTFCVSGYNGYTVKVDRPGSVLRGTTDVCV